MVFAGYNSDLGFPLPPNLQVWVLPGAGGARVRVGDMPSVLRLQQRREDHIDMLACWNRSVGRVHKMAVLISLRRACADGCDNSGDGSDVGVCGLHPG